MNSYKVEIAESLSQVLNLDSEKIVPLIGDAPENIQGDLSLPCFNFSKLLNARPRVPGKRVEISGVNLELEDWSKEKLGKRRSCPRVDGGPSDRHPGS